MKDHRSIALVAALLVAVPAAAPAAGMGALATLPGRTASVSEDRSAGWRRQTIVFPHDGGHPDRIEIELRPTGADPGAGLAKPSAAGIATELGRRFPGERMQVVRTPLRNRYGVVGHARGGRCLYAWQWLGPQELGSGGLSLSLRYESCGDEPAAVAAIERLRLDLRAGTGSQGARRTHPLATKPPIEDREQTWRQGVLERLVEAAPTAPPRVPRPARGEADADASRYHLGSRRVEPPVRADAPQPVTGPRAMVPIPSAPLLSAPSPSVPEPARSTGESEVLSTDLPVQAIAPPQTNRRLRGL